MKKLFNWSSLFGTIFIFIFMLLLQQIGLQFEFLNVFEQVFSNFELSDYYYSKIRDKAEVPFEENVVLVNIGKLPRRGIAREIQIINQYEPKVIGIDAKFFAEKTDDPVGDSLLMEAIKEVDNFVLATEPIPDTVKDAKIWVGLQKPPPIFSDHAHTGHVSTGVAYSDFITWREFPPIEKIKGGIEEPCLAVKMVELYDKEASDAFLKRKNDTEEIYFKGNLDKYMKLDVQDVASQNFDPELIKDKIVLMGYMGDGYLEYYFDEDKFYTPLNADLVGRGYPDMYGVVVHANIISMILEKNYINDMPKKISYLIAILLGYFNVALFSMIATNRKWAIWYNGISKLIQLVEAIVVALLNVFLFHWINYQAELTLTLFVILLSGDLTEIYVDVILNSLKRFLNK